MTDKVAPAVSPPEPAPPDAGSAEEAFAFAELPRAPRAWRWAFYAAGALALLFFLVCLYTAWAGLRVWGLNQPVSWGLAIVNFVFWIGIAHAGTLLSAVLFLCRQPWRTDLNRFAENMTLCALVCAALFPLLHLGRPGLAYWLAPYPNFSGLWPNFLSPLIWDLFALGAYFCVSLLFWYTGLLPDLAALRDRAGTPGPRRRYARLALGWTGSAAQWRGQARVSFLLAVLATPLALSVHSLVSLDFAVTVLPGWHSPLFPLYFVLGAVCSGCAMVVLLLAPARALGIAGAGLTPRHLDNLCRIVLAASCGLAYCAASEWFTAWHGGRESERFVWINRAQGPYAWAFWTMLACQLGAPQLFWWRRCRVSPWMAAGLCLLANAGMWLERFVIIVTSLHRDYLPGSWGCYAPTWADWSLLAGSFGLFGALFLLLCRRLPLVSPAERLAQASGKRNPDRGDGP